MARYDFTCPEHGRFEAWRDIAVSTAEVEDGGDLLPEPCPTCGHKASAVFSAGGATITIPQRFMRDKIKSEDVW